MATKPYNYALGRRKSSTVTIKLTPQGTGVYTLHRPNSDKPTTLKDYFGGRTYLLDIAMTPFKILGNGIESKYDAEIMIHGGGVAGHADSIKLAFARALTTSSPDFRLTLKPYGVFQRDQRIKERKKFGLKKARKAPTRSKR